MGEPQRPAPPTFSFVRAWLRAIHRDVGYVAVGLTFIYALSGLAVNHIADWKDGDANFSRYQTTHHFAPWTSSGAEGDDEAIARDVAAKLSITEPPREVYRAAPDQLDVLWERRTLHVNPEKGEVLDEGEKPRFFLRLANWLHLNRGKKAWTYVADAYAGALLFLSISGLFMIKGKKGLRGRGAILALVGIAIPVLYVTLAGGP
ncbi:PepSY-associated TM helix domain-containing protein [Pendulispora albinea]|uniref:PepSY-associated TM helix domain-containing protein n=1 Tax=Pendulispora albinea TaxID=2741071 RepID=A0ABZ2LYE1_9BACT